MSTARTILFFPLRLWVLWGEAWLARKTVVTEYKGVSICHSALHLWCNDEFTTMVGRALRLVEQTDSLRFARIGRFVRYVRPTALLGETAAQYVRFSKLCLMDWRKIRCPDDPNLTVLSSAIVLVHEATHGQLFSRGVRHTRARRSPIERLCVLEEARFIRHLDPVLSDAWLQVSRDAYAGASPRPGLVTDFRDGLASIRDCLARNSEMGLSIWK